MIFFMDARNRETSSKPMSDPLEEEPISLFPDEMLHPKRTWSAIWENVLRLGLGESTLRTGTVLLSVILFLVVAWIMGSFFIKGKLAASPATTPSSLAVEETPIAAPVQLANLASIIGINRLADLHTILPTKPRYDVTQYEVVKGDSIFGIAAKFNLQPETILWGNQYILGDNPENLIPGVVINILPKDGTYYMWNQGDGLNGVAKYFDVPVEDIIDWPGNKIDKNTLGDWAAPNIEPGTMLFVPGGRREFVDWGGNMFVQREGTAVSPIPGANGCAVTSGSVGFGNFVWPAVQTYLSGYDYSPATNHRGIDIAGVLGDTLFAVDNGVVVYSGWNELGYGNVVVLDHGNGWQSLYAHIMEGGILVGCGQSVHQGDVIAYMGSTGRSTGPHLHFELYHGNYGRVNPWDFLSR